MVFTTTNLFKGIACPEGEQCRLTSCIFSHDLRPQRGEAAPVPTDTTDSPREPASKRRKITADDKTGRPLSKSDQIHEQLAAERRAAPGSHSRSLEAPPSLSKAVSPPPTNGRKSTNNTSLDKAGDNSASNVKKLGPKPKENLNPRLIPNDPAGHAKRTLYLKHMHMGMVRLNQKVAEAKDLPTSKLLHLDDQEVIGMALDEEEALARSSGALYTNKLKQRVAAYKKMDTEAWIGHVKLTVIQPREKLVEKMDQDEKVIVTGLSPDDEVLILPQLVADQTKLARHGYVPTPPTEEEVTKAKEAVEFNKHYEKCDRCESNFQVFPERNEEGLLTSNGSCRFHPNRIVYPSKTKNDYNAGTKEPYHPCCNNARGSLGCTTHESHVFKISAEAPARLAAVLPFITTPENPSPKKDLHGKEVKAMSFDCEMSYTTCGLELIRLTAVNWPSGEELVDVLVRPVGTIIDLNSRFSGVFPEHFANAIPYEDWEKYVLSPPTSPLNDDPMPQILPLVPSIAFARELLTSFLTPSTPLIGHAIDNDLNATRLCHPTIIDTVLLFQHPRGLPYRFALRSLTLQHLGKRIQQGGERGHDSAEDARSTGDLVRVKVKEVWERMRRAGAVVEGGRVGRLGADGVFRAVEEGADLGGKGSEMARKVMGEFGDGVGAGRGGKKRRKGSTWTDGADDDEGESTRKEEAEAKGTVNGNISGIAGFLDRK